MDSMGQRLKKLRVSKGVRQKALAEALAVGQTTIANYEADIRQPNLDKLTLLADYFEITVDELLGRDYVKPNAKNINSESAYADMAKTYMDFLFQHEKDKAQAYIINLTKVGVPVEKIYTEIFVACLHEIGRLWENEVIGIGEEHYISEVTKALVSHFSVTRSNGLTDGKSVLIINLTGEEHDIPGKILEDYLERSGIGAYYMGSPLPLRSLVENLLALQVNLVVFSITMDENLDVAKRLISKLKSHPKMKNLRVLVGGQALDKHPGKWQEIGADAYADCFDSAVETVKEIFKDEIKEPDHEEE